jgi:hypothetical protein
MCERRVLRIASTQKAPWTRWRLFNRRYRRITQDQAFRDLSENGVEPSHDQILPQFGSTDAPADLLDDLHVRFQSSRRIVFLPRDTAFRPDGWIQWAEHNILVLEFFDLLWHESNTQSCGYCVNHSSFKVDILQNLGDKARAVTGLG